MSNSSSDRSTTELLAERQAFYQSVRITEVRTPPHLRLILLLLVTMSALAVFALAIVYDGPWYVTIATFVVTVIVQIGLWPPHGQENEKDQKGPPEPGPTLPRS